jgi:hypothetical protein
MRTSVLSTGSASEDFREPTTLAKYVRLISYSGVEFLLGQGSALVTKYKTELEAELQAGKLDAAAQAAVKAADHTLQERIKAAAR